MFDDYELAVLRDYLKKKDTGVLLTNLSQPTPANLKKECIAVFDRRYAKKDLITLSSFFEPREDEAAYRLAIKRWETDKFRPLNLILRKGGGNTDTKNIELLAWLIDFQPRPYSNWLKEHIGKINSNEHDINEEKPGEIKLRSLQIKSEQYTDSNPHPHPSQKEQVIFRPNKAIVVVMVILVFCIAGYFIFKEAPTGQEKCMYWHNDHYELITCGTKPADTTLTVLGLDTAKQRRFKKITRADTLTAASIGKVWYVRLSGGAIEYYTAYSDHPLYPERRLLPLTTGVLNSDYHSRVEK